MEYTLTLETVKAQLIREVEAIRGFEKNSAHSLSLMRRADPFDTLDQLAKGLRYNQQMAYVHYERARAVLELIGVDTEGMDVNADTLESTIGALK